MKALKCKMLGAELAHAYTLYCIISTFYVDDHLPTMHTHGTVFYVDDRLPALSACR